MKTTTLHQDMSVAIGAANRAQELYGLGMQVFQANAQRFDFDAADAERPRLHALLDEYMDSFLDANKRMQRERQG